MAHTKHPEFLRLPPPGSKCPVTGLCRSMMNSLILGDSPPVKSVSLAKPGRTRGIRLVVTESLLAHIHGQPSGAAYEGPSKYQRAG